MKLTFNDLERIIRMLENMALNETSMGTLQRRIDLTMAVSILRSGYLVEVPEPEKEKP